MNRRDVDRVREGQACEVLGVDGSVAKRQRAGRRLFLSVPLLALALVAACGEPVVGTVVGKEYDDADTYLMPVQHCIPVNNTTKCTTSMEQRYDPEHYVFKVQLDSDPGKTKKVSVDPTTYADTKVGDHYEESK